MKFLCFILALFIMQPTVVPNESKSAADYVINHFDEFMEEYNSLDADDCSATYIEYKTKIFVNDTQEEGYYIDFDGDNGFCIVTDEAVIDIHVKGDYPEIREPNDYMYDVVGGVFVKQGDAYVPYLSIEQPMLCDEKATTLDLTTYRIKIEDAGRYVNNTYGSKYKEYKSASLPNFTYQSQYDLSYFTKYQNGSWVSEGNCVLASVYSTLIYLKEQGVYPKLPSDTITIMPVTEDSYESASKHGYISKASKVKIPRLYDTIRRIATEKYGYEVVGGIYPSDAEPLMQDVLREYGYRVDVKSKSPLPFLNQRTVTTPIESIVNTNIAKGHPVVFVVRKVYGDCHAVVVTGYKYYRRNLSKGIIPIYTYVKIFQVADNHVTRPTAFDYTNYVDYFCTPLTYFK